MPNICPRCQTVNRAGARFCTKCGNALVPPPNSFPPPATLAPPPAPPVTRAGPNRNIVLLAVAAIGLFALCLFMSIGTYILYQQVSFFPKPAIDAGTLVNPLMTQAAPLQSEIPKIQSQIPKIQSEIPKLQTEIPKIQSQVPKIQTELPNLQTAFPTIKLP